MPITENESYLGDAVYARFDGWQIWLRTSDGVAQNEPIALDPHTYAALLEFARKTDFDRRVPQPGPV